MQRLWAVFTVGAVAAAGCVAVADTAAAAGDTAAPTVASFRVLPASVNVTAGPATATLDLRVVDTDGAGHPGTGFDHGTVTLTSGAHALDPVNFDLGSLQSGTAQNGSYDLVVPVPADTAPGSYTATSISLTDASNNAATSANSSAPLAVVRTSDTTPPVLVGAVTATPASVTTTQQPKTTTVSAHLTDNLSGVADASITYVDGNGDPQEVDLDRSSGTALDGVWTGDVTLTPQDHGTIPLTLVAHDEQGSTLTKPNAGSIAVIRTADSTPPAIVSAVAAPSTVNTTSADVTTTVTVHTTDDISGVVGGTLTYTSDVDGSQVEGGFGDQASGDPGSTLASGTALSGTWAVPVLFPARSTAGRWTLTAADVEDGQGNATNYPDDATTPASSVMVTTASDTTGPQLTSFTVGPQHVSTAIDTTVNLNLHAAFTDNVSGVSEIDVTFRRPDNSLDTDEEESTVVDPTTVTGTTLNGSLQFLATLNDPAAGNWSVANVVLTDLAGNATTVSGAGLGPNTTFTVSATATDTQPPNLTLLTFAPNPVDTRTGDQTVTATIGVTDPDTSSGLASGEVTLVPPSGNLDAVVPFDFGPDDLVSGDSANGTYRTTAVVPQYSETGTWTIDDLDLMDNAGNDHPYERGDVAAALGSAPTLSVTGATDTTPPTLTAISIASPTANVSNGDPVVVHVTGTDNSGGSGLASAEVTLRGPGGVTVPESGDLTPTAVSGTIDVAVTLPQYNSSGTWTIDSVSLVDAQGNARPYTSGDVAGFAGTHSVSVTSGTDTTNPVLTSVAVDPSSVNTTGGAVDADVIVHVTDAGSGVDSVSLSATSPHGTQNQASEPLELVAGTAQDGYWQGSLHFPAYVDAGSWILGVDAYDNAGNHLSVPSAATLAVTGPADTTPPTLTSFSLTPSSFNTSNGTQTVSVAANATDAGSGVAAIHVEVTSPDGTSYPVDLSPVGGGAGFTGSFEVQAYSQTGTYAVSEVDVTDVSGNVRSYTQSQLAAGGFVNTLTVTGTADTTGPALASLTYPSTAVDVSAGARTVNGTAVVTDSQSGFDTGQLTFTGPGGKTFGANFAVEQRSSGTINNATIPFSIVVPAYLPAGSYALSQVVVTDAVGNETDYPPTTLPAGTPAALTITDTNADTTAPKVTNSAVSPSAVDVRTMSASVGIDITVTDAGSGTAGGSVVVDSPHDLTRVETPFTAANRTSGTAANGVYHVTVPIPQHAEPGTYAVSVLGVSDAAGNEADYAGSALPGTRTFTVQSTPAVPDAPSDVTATPAHNSAFVDWEAPNPNGSPITGYVLTPFRAGVAQTPVNVGNTTEYKVTGLTDGTSYTFTVAAVNSVGTGSASVPTTPITPAPTAPGPPGSASATPVSGGANVTWTAPDDNGGAAVTGYEIRTYLATTDAFVKTQSVANVLATAVTGLNNGTGYYFTVAAINALGTGDTIETDQVTPTSGTAPGAPTGVTATAAGTAATVSWTAPASVGSSAVTGYTVTPYIGGTAQTPITVGNVLTTSVPGLARGTTYTFRVTATNAAGTGPQSAPSNAVTVPAVAPSAPTGASATLTGANGATVSWTASTSNGGAVISSYTATASPGGLSCTATTTTSCVIAGLGKGGSYTFTVTATNAAGTSAPSSPSNSVVVPVTIPAPPTGVTATLSGATGATVHWTAPADNGGSAITGYTVTPFVGGVAQAAISSPGTGTTATVSGLAKGSSYTFTVVATTSAGSSAASAPSAALTVPATAPGAPNAVSVVIASGGTGVTVSWTAPTDNGGALISAYTATASPGGKTCTVAAPTKTCTVTGLAKGTSYTFTVTATNSVGVGAPSAPSAALLFATAPGAPTGVTAAAGSGRITVSWTAPADNGGSAITGYTVTGAPGGSCTTTGATTCGVTGLTPGVSYTFTVTATNAIGTGPASTTSSAVTAPASAPGAPTAVTAIRTGATGATVSWTAPAANGGSAITGYTATAAPGGASCSSTAGTSCTIATLAKGGSYTFTVTATNAAGTGSASAPSNPLAIPASVPAAPTAVSAVPGVGSAVVRWSAPADTGGAPITGYTVAGSPGTGRCATTGATTCTVTGLVNGTSYTFTVTATNSVGTGPASAPSAAVAPTPVPTALTLTSKSVTKVAGSAVGVSGRLTRTDTKAAVAGQTIRLQYRRKGTTGAFITSPLTARTNAAGAVTFGTYKPAYSVQIRLVFPATTIYGASASGGMYGTLVRRITIGISPSSVVHGKTFKVSGSATPGAARYRIYLQRLSGAKWVNVTSVVIASSGYSFSVKSGARGTFSYRTLMPADSSFASSVSGRVALRVR